MVCGPLKEVLEERVTQLVLHRMLRLPYAQDKALHKSPLLLEELLQARIGGLWLLARHPDYNGY